MNICDWSKCIHKPIFEVARWDHVVHKEICARSIIRKTVWVLLLFGKTRSFHENFFKAFRETALETVFVVNHIGFSKVVSQKLEVIVSSGKRRSAFLFPCAFLSLYSDTCPHHLFCGKCLSDHTHRVGQNRCSQWVLFPVRVGWHHSVLCEGSFQISSRRLR